jgi:hypothetical protein
MMPVDSMRLKMPLPFPLRDDDDTQRVTEAAHAASRRGTSRRPRFSAALPIAVALLAFGASSASAVGLTLNWGGCIGFGAVPNQAFDCDNLGGPYNLVMNMQPPALTGFFAVDLVLDLQTSGAALSPFWHFEGGGCNELGLSISAARNTIPNTGCLATFTGSTGGSVSSLITAYAPGFGGANNARLLVTVARSASSPINLTAGSNYYLSHLNFALDNAIEAGGPCDGCSDGATIVLSSATLYTLPGSASTTLTGAGLGSNVATISAGATGLRLFGIAPTSGADSGAVRVQIGGRGIDPAATARLTLSGQSDIVGQSTIVTPDSLQLATTFDLTGRPAGPWDVVVQNPNTTTASLTRAFQILLTPHANSIAPSSAGNTGPVSCVVSGYGFTPGAVVQLVTAGQPTISGSGTVVAGDGNSISTVFNITNAAPGLRNVVVTSTNGLASTLINGFQILVGLHSISINPTSGADSGSVQAQIVGTGIDPAATVRLTRAGLSDILGQLTSVTPDSTRLTTTFDLRGHRSGPWNVVVQNPNGATASLANGFTIKAYPSVASIAPLSALDTGPAAVTLSGTGFETGMQVMLTRTGASNIPAASVSVAADGHTASGSLNLLDQPIGSWNVVVQNSNGLTSALPDGFQILPGPHITAVTPDHGTNDGVASIRIDGRGFQTGATARLVMAGFPDIVGQSVVVAPDGTSLTGNFDLTGAALGARYVEVTNPDLARATAPAAFQIQGLGISSVIPSHGQNTGVVSVAIIGSGFVTGASAWIVPPSGPPISGQSATVSPQGDRVSALFDLTGHAPAVCGVRVQNPNGSTITKPSAFLIESNTTFTSGLDLSWSACNQAAVPGTDDITLDCGNPGAVAQMFANFQSPQALPGFIALDAVLDVQTEGASLPPFWHFENGGCNAAGLGLSAVKPPAACPDAQNATPWEVGGVSTALITAYAPGVGGASHARLLLSIARSSNNPITLDGGRNYYGFHLELASADAASCSGCATPAQITWSSATLYGAFAGQPPTVLTGPGIRSNIVTVNGGPSGVIVASIEPSRAYPDGVVSARVFGRNFVSGMSVKLTRAGSPDIVGQSPSVAADGRSVTASFNLIGAASGLWDVVATNPGGASGQATSLFEVLSHAPFVRVLAPNGGERWRAGTTETIYWTASDDEGVTTLDFYLSQDDGQSFYPIATGWPHNDGYIPWTVPSPAARCFIKIVAHDAAGNTGEDVSDAAFEIFDVGTPTQLALFEGGWAGDRVEIRWRFAAGASFARVAVERAGNEHGPWSGLDATVRADGDVTVATDAGARADATSYYRLAATSADGNTRFFGPIVVAPAGGLASARETGITMVAPNPTAGALRIGFALARAGNVRLSVLDVQGREVATLARGEYAAGRFETKWNGRVGEGEAPMGVYFVRLQVGGVTMTRRLAVAR